MWNPETGFVYPTGDVTWLKRINSGPDGDGGAGTQQIGEGVATETENENAQQL